MSLRPGNDGLPWGRDDLILAFELYCRIPFSRTKANEPRVQELASLIGRTPASVARKLGNFGAFDPHLAARTVSGLTHGSKLDREVWDTFHADWNSLSVLADELRRSRDEDRRDPRPITAPGGPSETAAVAKRRLHQTFFREAVLSSYNGRCCVTGLPLVECLVAGHIVPWSVDESRRADPTNGLCMSATFDRLFERGLLTIQDDLTLTVSQRLLDSKDQSVAECVATHHGQRIVPPARFFPDPACLRWHRDNRFESDRTP